MTAKAEIVIDSSARRSDSSKTKPPDCGRPRRPMAGPLDPRPFQSFREPGALDHELFILSRYTSLDRVE